MTQKVQIHIWINPVTEPDILAKLQSEPNVSGYIKKLIREDIESSADEPP